MSSNGWPDWFARALAHHPSPDAYFQESVAYYHPVRQALLRHCPPPATLLEVGCGLGTSAAMFAMQGYHVTGIDLDPHVIEMAYRTSWVHGSGIDLHLGDAYNAPTGYDVATSLGIIEHHDYADRILMLRQLIHAARVAVVCIPTTWINRQCRTMGERDLDLNQLLFECRDAGWRIKERFGWGTPSQFARLAGFLPPAVWYRLQRVGIMSASLCVVGEAR